MLLPRLAGSTSNALEQERLAFLTQTQVVGPLGRSEFRLGSLFLPCLLGRGPQTPGLCLQAKMVEYVCGPRSRKSSVAPSGESAARGSLCSQPIIGVTEGSCCLSTPPCSLQSTFPGMPPLLRSSSSRQVVLVWLNLTPGDFSENKKIGSSACSRASAPGGVMFTPRRLLLAAWC